MQAVDVNKNQEIRLVTACSQSGISPGEEADIISILGQPLDWVYIFQTAGKNGLLPLFARSLLQNFSHLLTPEIVHELSALVKSITRNNMLLTLKLVEIVKILEKAGIPVLPFKGPTLALQAFNDLSLRHYSDLDILVMPKHFDESVKALSANGYVPLTNVSWLKRKLFFFTHKKDIVLTSHDNRVHIELHWKLSGSHFSMPVEISRLWNRLEKLSLGGTEVNSLPFNDLFVYLCLHGSRHEWERLSWIADLLNLVATRERSGKKINWNEIREHARNYGCERVLELGLFLVNYFFAVRFDYPNFEAIENNPAFKKIAEQVRARIFSQEVSPSKKSDKYMYLLSLQEKRTHRIKLYLVYLSVYLKLLFTPNSMDRSIFHLPAILYPLYFVLRPVRLLITYLAPSSLRKKLSKGKEIP